MILCDKSSHRVIHLPVSQPFHPMLSLWVDPSTKKRNLLAYVVFSKAPEGRIKDKRYLSSYGLTSEIRSYCYRSAPKAGQRFPPAVDAVKAPPKGWSAIPQPS